MHAMRLCNLAIEYELRVRSPMHVGVGGEGGPAGRIRGGRGKARADAQTSWSLGAAGQSKGEGDATLALPILRPAADGAPRVPYVPGTSLRGVLRHMLWRRLDRALATTEVAAAWRVDQRRGEPDEADTRLYGSPTEPSSWEARFGNVLIRHLFGSEARRGVLAVEDATHIANADGDGSKLLYSDRPLRGEARAAFQAPMRLLVRNRLDRFTMASTEGLRNLAAVDTGARFRGRITIRNFAWWQVGALALALRALDRGDVAIGARGGIGMGHVGAKVTQVHARWHRAVVAPPPDPGLIAGHPGVGHCLATLRAQLGDALDVDAILGRFPGPAEDGVDPTERQMFVHDPDDWLDDLPLPQPWAPPRPGFEWGATWTGDEAMEVMRRASARLARVAADLGTVRRPGDG